MTSSLVDLDERVAALEAERDIARTVYTAAHSIDVGDAQGWVDCFTDKGSFTVVTSAAGYEPYRVAGADELRQFAERHTRAPEFWHKHVVVDLVIRLHGLDVAAADSYFFALMDSEDVPIVRSFGRYADRLRSAPDGSWRIESRLSTLESIRAGLPALAFGRVEGSGSG